MIDVRRLRTELDQVKQALAAKGVDPADIDRAASLDSQVRSAGSRGDEIRNQVRALSKEVGQAHRDGDTERAEKAAGQSRSLGDELKVLDADAAAIENELRELLLRIPNLPAPDALVGDSEADNRVIRVEGYDEGAFADHQRVPHWDTGPALGILDVETAVKISGAMFAMLRGPGAALARALCQFALDRNADAYEEIRPPSLVLSDTLTATGQLPKFADDAYHVERDDLWAIPTAEVPLTSIGRNDTYEEADLPKRFMAYSPCYRREAGSAGRDTRGLLRVHEFDKVELLAYCAPEQGPAMHAEILQRAEGTLAALGLPYRVVEICTGDLGQPHAKQFDLEVYAPGCDMWLEASSVSWFTDYQARRANIRYRPSAGGGTAIVHTLNGSALAVPRVLAALIELNRQPDGSVRIPDGLRPYMRGLEAIPVRGS